jgi:uncharacterized membrane protein
MDWAKLESGMHKTVDELAHKWLPDVMLGEVERRVLKSAALRQPVAHDTNQHASAKDGVGELLADSIARIGGSWGFILCFLAFLVLWALLNVWLLASDAFDPYPFVFLNLILSMLAAIQAPVIMMSQNRQAARDRLDATHDYEVNLKAEIEIMALHEKMDMLRHSEITQMHERMTAMAAQLDRVEALVSAQKGTPA